MSENSGTRISGQRLVIVMVALMAIVTTVFLTIQFSGRGTAARNSMILHYSAGLRDLDQKYFASAVKNLTPVVESEVESAAFGFRGEAFLGLNEYKKAEADFRVAVEREPKLPANHAGLGIALYSQGRMEEAVPHLARAEELLRAPEAPRPGTVRRSGDTLDAVLDWKGRIESPSEADNPSVDNR